MSSPKQPRWIVAGHPSSQPDALVKHMELGDVQVLLIEKSEDSLIEFEELDGFALVVSAKTGVSAEMIDVWARVAERQIPRMVIVGGLELSEIDFDDIVLILNRVLENVITPYLVLHDEIGEPTGLISLADDMIHDYSTGSLSIYPADEEMSSLVKEFREELELATAELDESAYAQGLIVPAIPFVASKKIGNSEILKFAHILTKR